MTAWIAFYADDYLGDTQDLSLLEHGAYIRLLAAYYASDGQIPSDSRRLYRLCGAFDKGEQRAVDAIVRRYFGVDDGRLTHDRADREILRAHQKSEAARKANAVRWQSDRTPTGSNSDIRSDSSPEPEPEGEGEGRATTRSRGTRSGTGNGSGNHSGTGAHSEGEARETSSPRRSHGTRLPDDWMVTAARLQEARRQGLSDEQAQREGEKFRDYWHAQPGQRGRKADWEATWRNWCRRAAEQQPRGRQARQDQSDAAIERWLGESSGRG